MRATTRLPGGLGRLMRRLRRHTLEDYRPHPDGRYVVRVEDGEVSSFAPIPADACVVSAKVVDTVRQQCTAISRRMLVIVGEQSEDVLRVPFVEEIGGGKKYV